MCTFANVDYHSGDLIYSIKLTVQFTIKIISVYVYNDIFNNCNI